MIDARPKSASLITSPFGVPSTCGCGNQSVAPSNARTRIFLFSRGHDVRVQQILGLKIPMHDLVRVAVPNRLDHLREAPERKSTICRRRDRGLLGLAALQRARVDLAEGALAEQLP